MRIATFIFLHAGALLLVSCTRTPPATPRIEQKSLEQRLVELEQHLNTNAPRVSEAEARKQHEHDLAEIQRMGSCGARSA
jgi:hypothetical protein